MLKFNNKRCPRCNFKMPKEIAVCPKCQLKFQKFELATNQEAKQALRQGDGDRVLYRKGCPNDVKKYVLILLAVFLGFCGAHYYYVGRTKMGMFFSVFFCVGIVNAVLTTMLKVNQMADWYQIFYLLVLVWGVVIVLWIVDIVKICFNTFKIPVSLPRV